MEEGANENELDELDSSLTDNLLYSDDSESEEDTDPYFMQLFEREITDSHSKIAEDPASDSNDLTESLDGTSDLPEAPGRIDLSTISQKTRDLSNPSFILRHLSHPDLAETAFLKTPNSQLIFGNYLLLTTCLMEYIPTLTITQNNGKTLLIKNL